MTGNKNVGYVQHLSVRVPWHDAGWDGSVCRDPLSNSSCILLKNIGEKREDFFEVGRAGEQIAELEPNSIPCVAERSTFLSPRDHVLEQKHPYGFNDALRNITPATVPVPAWSVHATPYYWLNRKTLADVQTQHPIEDYSPEREAAAVDALGFEPTWILHGDNQKAVIDAFFRDVRPSRSLVFFYLKHSPFEDAAARLLVGAALVDEVTPPGWWPTNGATAFPNHMWETTLRHTLRPDGTGGVLLPMQELAALAEGGADVSAALAPAPKTAPEFSYVTEHVPPDLAVAALFELRRAADAAVELGCSVPASSVEWLDEQLAITWRRRGPSPGLPAVLPQLGWAHPTFAAHTLAAAAGDEDPWTLLVDALEGHQVPDEVQRLVTRPRQQIWAALDDQRKQVLRLLARFDLTAVDVGRVVDDETAIELPAANLLRDPYLLVICTADDDEPIDFGTVDRGCYPDPALATRHPLPVDEPFDDPIDARRVEAALTAVTAAAQRDGHTLLPQRQALDRVDALVLQQPLHLNATLLSGLGLSPAALDDVPDLALEAERLAVAAGPAGEVDEHVPDRHVVRALDADGPVGGRVGRAVRVLVGRDVGQDDEALVLGGPVERADRDGEPAEVVVEPERDVVAHAEVVDGVEALLERGVGGGREARRRRADVVGPREREQRRGLVGPDGRVVGVAGLAVEVGEDAGAGLAREARVAVRGGGEVEVAHPGVLEREGERARVRVEAAGGLPADEGGVRRPARHDEDRARAGVEDVPVGGLEVRRVVENERRAAHGAQQDVVGELRDGR